MENTKKKLPFGFYVWCLTYSFERLAYYAAKWGLTIFIAATAANGGLGLDKSVDAGTIICTTRWTTAAGSARIATKGGRDGHEHIRENVCNHAGCAVFGERRSS